MLKQFAKEIADNNLCKEGHHVLLAISGGLDSMVMLDLFHRLGYSLSVAHCNFQLRSNESDADEQFVKDACDQLKVGFYSYRFDTNNYAAENNLSIQMAARELRYTWFNQLMQQHNFDCLATAHHLNDNLETVLINLVRGSGLSGLRGIPIIAGKTIRPLLSFTRTELENHAKTNDIKWREDISNSTDDYDRNFFRHNVIPKLREVNPSLEVGFKITAERLRGAHALAELGLEGLKEEFVISDKNQIKISKAVLTVTPFPRVIAWELLKGYGFNYAQCQNAVTASLNQSGKKFFSTDYQLVVDRDAWIISKLQEKLKETLIDKGQNEATLGALTMQIEHGIFKEISVDPLIGMFDSSKIHFPIIWRRWEKGDSFKPLGMDNRKKLSDFFIDHKVSITDKQDITVLESNGDIIWVVGHRIDNRYKVEDLSKEVIQFKLLPYYD